MVWHAETRFACTRALYCYSTLCWIFIKWDLVSCIAIPPTYQPTKHKYTLKLELMRVMNKLMRYKTDVCARIYETLVATRTGRTDGHMNMAFVSLLRSNWMQRDPWSERNNKDVLLLNMRVCRMLMANVVRLSHHNYNHANPCETISNRCRSITSFVQWVDEYWVSHHWTWHLCVKFNASSAIDVNI